MTPGPAAGVTGPTSAGSRPAFFWWVLAWACLFAVTWGSQGRDAFNRGATSRVIGWTARPASTGWVIDRVDPHGPAAGLVAPGDRLLAIDGDARVARVGPLWSLQDLPPASAYALETARAGQLRTVRLRIASVEVRGYRSRAAMMLVLSLGYFFLAVFIGLAKPGNAVARLGSFSSMLIAAFMLSLPLRAAATSQPGALLLALEAIFPLHVLFTYRFLERFPAPVASSWRWRVVGVLLWGTGLILWLMRASIQALRAAGPSRALPLLDSPLSFLSRYMATSMLAAELLFAAAALAGVVAVLTRNHRMLPGPGDRRRLRLTVVGILVPTALALFVTLINGLAIVTGFEHRWSGTLSNLRIAANMAFLLSPITLTYSMLKHQVLGVRVIVRIGLQYLLASQSLRVALALPVVAMAWRIFGQRQATLAEILFSPGAVGNWAVLALCAGALRFRGRLTASLDRRFFREAYDQERILTELVDAVRGFDTLEEIARVVDREVEAALHVRGVRLVLRDPVDGSVSFVHDSNAQERREPGSQVATLDAPRAMGLPETSAIAEADTVDPERAEDGLEIPITGRDGEPLGRLVLGAKRSEEPFTARDRQLLRMVAAHVGGAYEIIALKKNVGRQQQVEREVLGRLDQQGIQLVRECPECGTCYDSSSSRCERDGRALTLSQPIERTVRGRYRLDRVLGRGGMGVVFAATDLQLHRTVALKVVSASGTDSAAAQRRFSREAQAVARLDHPHIVRVHDFGTTGASAFLVMEFVTGSTWRAELARLRKMPPPLAAGLLDQAMDAMQAAHAAGVLHRDLKPDNLFLARASDGDEPSVKILDFGLAKVRDEKFEDPKSLTTAGIGLGTPGYMSPEQWFGLEATERTDVYSLGVIALESLTGKLDTARHDFHRQNLKAVNRLRTGETQDGAPARLAVVLERALAYEASERIASVAALRAELIPAIRACDGAIPE